MKILHLVDGIPPVTLGGTGRIVCEIAHGQSMHGHSVGILSAAGKGVLPETMDGVRLLTVPQHDNRWAHYRCVFSGARERDVLAHIDAFQPDIVHAHTISRQLGYRWMAQLRKRGIRLVVTCHDVSHVACGKVTGTEPSVELRDFLLYRYRWNPLRSAMIRSYLANADHIFTVSDALKQYMEKRGYSGLQTLHNGIDAGIWKPDVSKADARRALRLPPDKFLFLIAGRMGVDKGSTLVDAVFPKDAHLLAAGDGFSDEFGPVAGRMHIFRNQSATEMRVQYAACDCVIVPSRCLDCFPTVCLEAMAMQRPVIATSWGGAKESVEDGVTGWILDPMNESAWRGKMQWCIGHSEELAAMGRAGRTRVEKHFALSQMLTALDNAYAGLAEKPLHVTLVVSSLIGRDGWSRYARDLSRALAAEGVRVSALVNTPTDDAPWCEQVPVLRPPLHSLSLIGCLAQYIGVRRSLKKLQPDAVHVIAEPYALLLGMMPLRCPWLLTIHGSYAVIPFLTKGFSRAATMRAWRRLNTIISVSEFTKRYVRETEPEFFRVAGLDRKITVIPNAIALRPAEPKMLRREGERRILGVGAVKARKGYLQAVRSLAEYTKISATPLRYDIIGGLDETPYVEELKRECDRLGLKDIVHLRGSVSEQELKDAYRDADAFLLLSIFERPHVEGFVLAFLEAAAHGVPSIGPATGGCPEAIRDGVSGYVCDPDHATVIAKKLQDVLERHTIKPEACRAWAEAHDIEKASAEILRMYRPLQHAEK